MHPGMLFSDLCCFISAQTEVCVPVSFDYEYKEKKAIGYKQVLSKSPGAIPSEVNTDSKCQFVVPTCYLFLYIFGGNRSVFLQIFLFHNPYLLGCIDVCLSLVETITYQMTVYAATSSYHSSLLLSSITRQTSDMSAHNCLSVMKDVLSELFCRLQWGVNLSTTFLLHPLQEDCLPVMNHGITFISCGKNSKMC